MQISLPYFFALLLIRSFGGTACGAANVPVDEASRELVVLENCHVEPKIMPDLAIGSYDEDAFNEKLAAAGFNGVTFTGNSDWDVVTFNQQLTRVDPSETHAGARPEMVLRIDVYAEFDTIVSMVSVDLGDFNGDAEVLYLDAFNEADGLLDQAVFENPAASEAFHRLIVEAPNIKRVHFYSTGTFPNSILWDVFAFCPCVPECVYDGPGTCGTVTGTDFYNCEGESCPVDLGSCANGGNCIDNECIDNESYCCSWTGSTCGLDEWCNQSEANCLGNCNGEWINPSDYFPKEDHCCSYDQYNCADVDVFCSDPDHCVNECSGYWVPKVPETECIAAWQPCLDNERYCCGDLVCRGNEWYKQCE